MIVINQNTSKKRGHGSPYDRHSQRIMGVRGVFRDCQGERVGRGGVTGL